MQRTTMLQDYIGELIESARDKQQRALAAYRAACHEEEHGRQMRDEYYRLTSAGHEIPNTVYGLNNVPSSE